MKKLSLFTRMGGKYHLRKKIVRTLPQDYKIYVECFVGSGQVFLEMEQKENKTYIINDLNRDIYDIWKDLQTTPEEEIKLFDFIDDKQLFQEMKQKNTKDLVPTERLFRNLYLSYYSYSGLRQYYTPKPYKKGNALITNVCFFKNKVKDTIICNEDYKEILKRFDSPETIFYLDPPYVDMEKYYEKNGVDPYELATCLRCLKGKFVLSYNKCDAVEEAFRGFHFEEIGLTYTSGVKSKKQNEYLIRNFE